MRIGMEVQRLFRRNKHGMEVVALELIKKIQELDLQNEYVLFAKNDENRGFLKETANFKVQALSSVTYADWEQFVLPKAIRRFGVDLLHCTCNTGPVSVKVPLILTLHDIIYLENIDFKGSSYQNFGNLYRRFVVPKVVQKSEVIITVSEFEKKVIIERLNISPEKVKVIYNGVNQRFSVRAPDAEIAAFRKKYRLPKDFILFLGNSAPKKNTMNVLKAYIDYCSNKPLALPIVIVDYEQALVAGSIKKMNASHCMKFFHFPGYISFDEMPLMYQSASLFLYPSLRESFGMPVLESMASGTPVITSNTSSMPEVAGEAAMLVDPFRYEQISAGISRMLEDSLLRQTFIARGHERVGRFSWHTAATQLISLYADMKK